MVAKPLTVYKASAGSGKTFTLTTEYIKMLIGNPVSYRNILAVTFTNKATEEMKDRILSQLYGIWRQLPDSDSYLKKVCSDLDISPSIASHRAGQALTQILHHYNYFRIQTIDTFFQTILRNLARELDLTANFRIDLNDDQAEEEAIDSMIDSLSATDEVLSWILDFIRSNIDDDKTWNVIGALKSFGKNIFKDYYKENEKALNHVFSDKTFFTSYKKTLNALRQKALDTMRHSVEQFYDLLQQNGIDESEIKRNTLSYFLQQKTDILPTSKLTATHKKALTSSDEWIKKATSAKGRPRHDFLQGIVEGVLMPFYQATEHERQHQWNNYITSTLILNNLHKMRLLGTIDRMVHESNANSNHFLLSDTQHLLQALISDSDTPFIFEKAGTQISHIMIDEFQDTSVVQWQNFKVLLDECMSKTAAGGNLIVGDVKQSIYRWRSGDWQLLNSIDQQFRPASDKMRIVSLATNYRSQRNIILFNNAFFKAATQIEAVEVRETSGSDADKLCQAYADVAQEVPDGKPDNGLVEIALIPSKKKDDDSYNADEEMLRKVADTLQRLFARGVKAHSIAILSRKNEKIQQIAEYLSVHMPEVPVISKEAYRMDSSIAINAIIWVMRYLLHPDDEIALSSIAAFYIQHVDKDALGTDALLTVDEARRIVEEHLTERVDLATLPLFDIAEYVQRTFRLNDLKGQSSFLCSFFDKITAYTVEHPSDIEGFLEEWDSVLHKKSIFIDGEDGIRMLTIHSSKGLEFDHVIFPFCDWDMKVQGDIWCMPQNAPFNQLPIVPVPFSKDTSMGTDFQEDMQNESFQNRVDHLNLLYVAFTRASRNLFIFGKQGSASSRSHLLQEALPTVVSLLEEAEYTSPEEGDGTMTFTYGQLSLPPSGQKREASLNVFNAEAQRVTLQFQTFRSKVDYKQSNDSKEFVATDDEQQQNTYIKTGNLLHSIFSNVSTEADIPHVLTGYEERGLLSDSDISRAQLQEMMEKRLSNTQARQWFQPGWTLFNECTILSRSPVDGSMEEHRPDRVMMRDGQVIVVDFKFGTPKKAHHAQVQRYIALLASMGYHNISGYLWYFYSNRIEPVAP